MVASVYRVVNWRLAVTVIKNTKWIHISSSVSIQRDILSTGKLNGRNGGSEFLESLSLGVLIDVLGEMLGTANMIF